MPPIPCHICHIMALRVHPFHDDRMIKTKHQHSKVFIGAMVMVMVANGTVMAFVPEHVLVYGSIDILDLLPCFLACLPACLLAAALF